MLSFSKGVSFTKMVNSCLLLIKVTKKKNAKLTKDTSNKKLYSKRKNLKIKHKICFYSIKMIG